jgi:hypothetical protein
VSRFSKNRCRAGQSTEGINEISRCVGGAAFVAIVSILIGGLTLGTRSLDKAVGKEDLFFWIEELFDLFGNHQVSLLQSGPEFATKLAVLFAVRASVMIKTDPESREVPLVLMTHSINPLLLGDSLSLGADHDRCSMGIVSADEHTPVPSKPLKPSPNIRLDILDQMTQVDWPVGIGQSRCDQNLACCHVDESLRNKRSAL